MEEHDIKRIIQEGIKDAFEVGERQQRFVDVSRIPLICQSIVQISQDIKEINENMVPKYRFDLVERIVYGSVSVILLGVLGALMTLVLR